METMHPDVQLSDMKIKFNKFISDYVGKGSESSATVDPFCDVFIREVKIKSNAELGKL